MYLLIGFVAGYLVCRFIGDKIEAWIKAKIEESK